MPVESALGLAWAAFVGEGAKLGGKSAVSAMPWAKLYRAVKGRLTAKRVVITGMPGVGKTVLRKRLCGDASIHFSLPRTSQYLKRQLRTGDRCYVDLWDVPGQAADEQRIAHEKLSGRGCYGVIHAVSYGYAQLRDSSAQEIVSQLSGPDLLDEYRKGQLIEEVNDLRRTLERIRAIPKKRRPRWIIITPTKLDLYANQAKRAAEYYSLSGNSPFAYELREFRARPECAEIGFHVYPVCTTIEPLTIGQVKVPSQFSDTERSESLALYGERLEDHCGG